MIKRFFSIFVFFILKYFINCDACTSNCLKTDKQCINKDSYSTCPSNCRPNFLVSETNACVECTGAIGANKCYHIKSDGKCEIVTISGSYKLVYNSNPPQCVASCGDKLSEMGDFCYELCIGGNRVESGTSSKQCKCRYLYYTKTENSHTKYECLNQNDYCDGISNYYDFDTGECTSSCNGKKAKSFTTNGNKKITRCSTYCLNDEYVSGSNCVDDCADYYEIKDGIKTCVSSCEAYDENNDKKCKTFSECKYISYSNNLCLSSCPSEDCILDNKFCLTKEECAEKGYKYYLDTNINAYICSQNCPKDLVKEENNDECELNIEKCFYKENAQNPKICYSKCEAGYYCYDEDHIMRSDCSGSFKYRTEKGNICYRTCDRIPSIGEKYYTDGYICRCYFYDETNDKCYNTEQDCADKDLHYIEDRICKNSGCSSDRPYKVKFTPEGHQYFYRCFNKAECIEKKYYYYYKDSNNNGECWVNCLGSNYPYENGTDYRPKEVDGNTCTPTCASNYKLSKGICKSQCSQNEYLASDNICINQCDSSYHYISENDECLVNCDKKIFPQPNGLPRCVNNCKDYKKYEFNGACYDSCNIGNIQYKYDDFECKSSCPEYTYNNTCMNSVIQGKFYYDDKTIVDNCDPYYISKDISNKCVTSCDPNLIYENRCRVGCPLDAPYIDTDANNKKICVTKCAAKTIVFENLCVNVCNNPYFPKDDKCYRNCDSQYLDPKTGNCTSNCPTEFPYHEKIVLDNNKVISICKSSCDGDKKIIDYDKECVTSCKDNHFNYIDIDNTCKGACSNDNLRYYYKGKINGIDIYICLKTCPNETYIYEVGDTDKQCYDKCPDSKRRIVQFSDNRYLCVNSCPEEYPYYYLNEDNINKVYLPCTNYYKCTNYFKDGYCDTGCKEDTDYIQSNFCKSLCDAGFNYIKKIGNYYKCQKYCDINEFIENIGKHYEVCVDKCSKNNMFIGNDKKCKSECSVNDGKHYYPFSPQSGYTIFKCTKTCSNSSYPLSSYNDQQCYKSCNDAGSNKYLSRSENKCYSNCLNSPKNKYTHNGIKECLYECKGSTYPYYFENDANKECLTSCAGKKAYVIENTNKCISNCKGLGYYAYQKSESSKPSYGADTCVIQCPPDLPYAIVSGSEIYCKEGCDSSNKFFVKEFKHSENDLQRICMSKCPSDYPYYTIYKDTLGNKANECQNTCDNGYLIITGDDQLCIPTCPYTIPNYPTDFSDYKYKYIDGNNKKICTNLCPGPDKKFHKENAGSDCLKKCPDDAPFYEKGNVICKNKEQITCDYINYDTGECMQKNECDKNQYTTKIKGSNKYLCSEKCNSIYGIYKTPYMTCVNDCINDDLVKDKYLIYDNQNEQCICKNLFYLNKENNKKKVCFNNLKNNTKCKYLHATYNVNVFGTNECIEKEDCKGILSPSNDICYDEKIYTCGKIDKNSIPNGSQCKCKNKFYKTEDSGQCDSTTFQKCDISQLNMTICLDENGACPLGYEKFIPETKECVNKCPDEYYLFRNLCLSEKQCDTKKGFVIDTTNKLCKCNKDKWYNNDPKGIGEFHCVDTCPEEKGYLVSSPSESECLKSCKETYYPYFYEKKCYTSCANSDFLNIVNGFEIFESPTQNSNLANFHCDCLNPWYKDGLKKICSESKYPDSITDCKNFTNPPKFKYMIKSSLECITTECPSTPTNNYSYHFNNECFKDCTNDASQYYHYLKEKDDGSNECECINLWFNNSINKAECIEIDINECIKFNFELKYKINETRQCVSKCPPDTMSFNYVCYKECPENTTKSDDGKSCICNTTYGYWYKYEKDNGTDYLKCALEECPKENEENNITHARKNLVEEKGECLASCSKDDTYKFALRYICREDCPYFMDINPEKDECVFFDLNNDVNITNITLLKDAANIQVKELYEGSQHLGGYLFNRFNASLHIYAIDINNSLGNISFKSNLTYVDFSTCVKKIFTDNEKYLNENLTILVAKYDILTDTINDYSSSKSSEKDKYLINKVEYELFSSNMSEKLEIDGATCNPYELIVSYPLTLNRFNEYEGDLNKNEYRKKFEMGKKLHLRDNNIDTFNINNTVYKTFCRSVEIDGKDLVYEDRYKYLYPNNKVLCESNCIMNNTNFDLERIICLCSFKEEIVFNREDEAVDIFNDPNFTLPTQSRFNAEAVKCLFNFTLNETIFYNDAFYYSSVVLIVKFAMIFVSSFSGVKNLAANIKHLLSKLNKNMNFGKRSNKPTKRIKFTNDNVITTTGRALKNPPKKPKEKYNEDIDLDSDDRDSNINNTILENYEEDKDDQVVNYEINIKKGINPYNKDNKDNFYDSKSKNKNKDSSDNNNIKAEYIPPDFNFKFFKSKDKGVMKKIERNEIPFDISPETNYLIERREGIDYPEDYLNGPYYPEQNIVIITDSKNKDPAKLAKYLKDEKMMKKKINPTVNKNLDDNKSNNNSNAINDKKSQKVTINEKNKTSFYHPKTIGEKSFVSIKKVNPNDNLNESKAILDELDGDHETKTIDDDDTSIFYLIKREHLFLRVNYETYIRKVHPYYLHIFFAEIFDKIYIFKILLFLRQTDVFSVHFSLYVFCHILLMTLLCNLFTIDLIKKIWETTDFPDIRFYLLYGLISNLIIWVIYQIFLYLIDFDRSIRNLVAAKNNMQKKTNNDDDDNIIESNENNFYKKFSCLMCLIRLRISIFHILTFSIAVCCGIYLIAFFALYTGTKSLVLKIYYISIVEILLIKVAYGIILSGIRIVSKEAKLKALYIVVYILDNYLS